MGPIDKRSDDSHNSRQWTVRIGAITLGLVRATMEPSSTGRPLLSINPINMPILEHSITYVRANLEKIIKAGIPIRITRHGMTVGYYNPVMKQTPERTWVSPDEKSVDEYTGMEIIKE